ncbi:MAG: hypothetical protein Aureis2KO_09280 [Aureisphaera sp.]
MKKFLILLLFTVSSCSTFCKGGSDISYDEDYDIEVYNVKKVKGFLCINNEYIIDVAYDNSEPKRKFLHDILQKGDRLITKAHNDTIHLLRDQESFWFILHGDSGSPDKKATSN